MNTVLFDLDGTLLPMDVKEFTDKYFGLIVQTMNENGRDGKFILKAIGKGVENIIQNNVKDNKVKITIERKKQMKKTEFLAQLRGRLGQLPPQDIEKTLEYYSEMIDDKIEDGKCDIHKALEIKYFYEGKNYIQNRFYISHFYDSILWIF